MAKKIYYQEEIETMPVDQLKALQKEKLLKQVKYVYEHNDYYRNLITLPLHTLLSDEDVDFICDALRGILRG